MVRYGWENREPCSNFNRLSGTRVLSPDSYGKEEEEKEEEEEEQQQQQQRRVASSRTGHALLRAFLLAISVSAYLLSRKMAYATIVGPADPTLLPVSALFQQSKNGFSSVWPKFVQVMGVFRDQGLLLSVLLGLSAFFSMSETAITTLWPWKVSVLPSMQ